MVNHESQGLGSMNDKLMECLTINELWDALATLPKNSCSREDEMFH